MKRAFEEMRAGYRDAGGPSLSVFVGRALGMCATTAVQTVVAVITLRLLGVL